MKLLSSRFGTIAAGLAVLAVFMVPFLRAGSYGIIQLDDYQYLVGHSAEISIPWAFTWAGDGMWTPLTWISYLVDFALFGANWGAFHIHSVILHFISYCLFWWLLCELFKQPWICLVAALVWAVHPLRVESVTWLASRKDVLSAVFFLAALLCWMRAKATPGLVLSLVFLLLGGLSKNSVMVFPAFSVAIDLFFLRRRKPYWAYAAILLLCIGFAAVAGWAQGKGDAYAVTSSIPRWFVPLNAFAGLTLQLVHQVWPLDLGVQCVLKWPAPPRCSMAGLILLAAFGWWLSRFVRAAVRERRVLSLESPEARTLGFVLLFLAALSPFLGFVGFGCHAFADRFTLLPSLALSIALVVWMGEKKSALRIALPCLAVLAFAVLTWRQVGYWKDDRTLFEHTLAVDGDNNVVAHKVLMLDAWEYGHDMERVFEHGKFALKAVGWQAEMILPLVYLGIEAAYETGHVEEAKNLYYASVRWSAHKVEELRAEDPAIGDTDTGLFSEVVRLAYTEGQLQNACEHLVTLEKIYPEHFAVKNLRYLVTRRSGDAKETARAKRAAYAPNCGELLICNRWALKE